MRYLKLAALGFLALGISANASTGTWKSGVSAQGSELNDRNEYRPGMGVNGFTTMEHATPNGAGVAGLGIRANYTNYQIEGDQVGKNLNEGGVALTGLVGPNSTYFQPRVGGHVGYERLSSANFVDLGADLMASYKVTPRFGINAMVTPTWYMKGSDLAKNTDYLTKIGLGVVWSTPGA